MTPLKESGDGGLYGKSPAGGVVKAGGGNEVGGVVVGTGGDGGVVATGGLFPGPVGGGKHG